MVEDQRERTEWQEQVQRQQQWKEQPKCPYLLQLIVQPQCQELLQWKVQPPCPYLLQCQQMEELDLAVTQVLDHLQQPPKLRNWIRIGTGIREDLGMDINCSRSQFFQLFGIDFSPRKDSSPPE